jgi:spore germination protein YaaH
MGYGFHDWSGPHLGPIAPLGWIQDVAARVERLGAPEKYSMGIANYAIGSGWFGSTADGIARCGGNYSSTTNHMLTCSLGNQAAGTAPNCSNQGGVWFEDAVSAGEKASASATHHVGGVSYWALGGEPPGWFDAISKFFP